MARILLHAGFAKTGSTSLQAMLEANAGRLPPGCRYVPNRSPQILALRRLARDLPPDAGAEDLARLTRVARRTRARLDPQPGETLILSSEDFAGGMPKLTGNRPVYGHSARLLAAIVAGFEGDAVEVVLYTRDAPRWLGSWYRVLCLNRRRVPPWTDWSAQPAIAGFSWETITSDVAAALPVPPHLLTMEADLDHRLGVGAGLLALAGLGPEVLARFEPGAQRNAGPSDRLARFAQSPPVRWLPGGLRRRLLQALHPQPRHRPRHR